MTQRHGKYWISLCYETHDDKIEIPTQKHTLQYLKNATPESLQKHPVGIDRRVALPTQAGDQSFDLSTQQQKHKEQHARHMKRLQKQLAPRQKSANRYQKSR